MTSKPNSARGATLRSRKCDGIDNGMPDTVHRTTFALDEVTAGHLQKLASLWQVSQAEVIRRAVAKAEADSAVGKPDPVVMLRKLHGAGHGLKTKAAHEYLAKVRADRKRETKVLL